MRIWSLAMGSEWMQRVKTCSCAGAVETQLGALAETASAAMRVGWPCGGRNRRVVWQHSLTPSKTGWSPYAGNFYERSPAMTDGRAAVTEIEAATRLALSVATLRAWRHRGRGPRFVRFGRAVRYLAQDLDAF